jgi:hypothetical protein
MDIIKLKVNGKERELAVKKKLDFIICFKRSCTANRDKMRL